MQRLMNARAGGSAIKIGSLLQAKWRAQEWAKENIHECLDDCDEYALLDITEPDGVAVNVQCPILSKECPRGRKYLSAINSLAVESMPHDIPKLFRTEVESADETLAVSGARMWNGKGFLYLYGATGTGKSFAAAWRVYRDIRVRLERIWNSPGEWRSVAVSSARWFSAFAVCLERSNLYEAENAGFLILDDLGCEMKSPSNAAILNELIGVRYNEKRPTIITSNCSLAELESRYMSRMYERIIQSNSVIDAGITNKRL